MNNTLPQWKKFVYALPSFTSGAAFLFILTYLPKYYTDVLLLKPVLFGIAFGATKVFDAVNDPLVGYFSDRAQTPLGRRRPFILGSIIPYCLAYYFIWSPPAAIVGTSLLFPWLAVANIMLFMSIGAYVIPYQSLGVELIQDTRERTRLSGLCQILTLLGSLVGVTVPPHFIKLFPNAQVGHSTLALIFMVASVLSLLLMLVVIKEPANFQERSQNATNLSFWETAKTSLGNKNFRRLIFAWGPTAVSQFLMLSLDIYVVTYWFNIPEFQSWYLGLLWSFGAVGTGMWVRLSKRIGKKESLQISQLMRTAVLVAHFFIPPQALWAIIPLVILRGLSSSGVCLYQPMLYDTIDEEEYVTGQRREGSYNSMWSISTKLTIAGAFLVLAIPLALSGYRPNEIQTPEVLLGLKVIFCLVPAFLCFMSYILVKAFDLTEARHDEIRAEIDARLTANT